MAPINSDLLTLLLDPLVLRVLSFSQWGPCGPVAVAGVPFSELPHSWWEPLQRGLVSLLELHYALQAD